MEHLPNGFTLEIPEGCFPLGTDSMVLSSFVKLPRHARVLDLGSGCATLGTLLCARDAGCHVTGVELDPIAHEAALANIRRNGLETRLESICADLRQIPDLFAPGYFSCCLSNPPYFSGGPASSRFSQARQEQTCTLAQLVETAGRALKYGGDFFLVHRPERLAQIIALGSKAGMEAKRLCLVRHRENAPVNLILLQLRKGAKLGLSWEELTLYHPDGTPTDACRGIYHI